MDNRSPYQRLRQIEFMINGLRPGAEVERAAHKAFEGMQKRVQAALAVLRDYELSESEEDTRASLRILPRAVKSLENLQESILLASQYDLVGAAEVAHVSAQLDELIDRLD